MKLIKLNSNLKENERIDDLQVKDLKLIQNSKLYSFTSDAVLIANFVKVKSNSIVCDLGSGSGVIAILIAGKSKAKKVYAVEIQDCMVDMAKRSVELNNLFDKVEVIQGLIQDSNKLIGNEICDIVVSNPPYSKKGSCNENLDENKAIARHEKLITLSELIQSASRLLKFSGEFYLVHQAKRLNEIMVEMEKYNLKVKTLRLVASNIKAEPHLVLIRAVKGANYDTKILPTLYMNNEDGSYSDEVREIYRKESL